MSATEASQASKGWGWSSVSRQRARAWPYVTEVRLVCGPRRCRLVGLAKQRPRRRPWRGESDALNRVSLAAPPPRCVPSQPLHGPGAGSGGLGSTRVWNRASGELGPISQGLGCGLWAPIPGAGGYSGSAFVVAPRRGFRDQFALF